MLLEVKDISKTFSGEAVLKQVSFQLDRSETFAILGRSGCGKTTLLKILSGLLMPDSGTSWLNGVAITESVSPQKRNIVYLSQEPLLFPHLSVFENIAFGLRVRKEDKSIVKQKVESLAAAVGLSAHLDKKPEQLSGGQKQRVNFGRALIIDPPVLLLDEPFGSLDTKTRAEMQVFFKEMATTRQISSVFVTHDLKEALLVGDAIAYMDGGKLKTYLDKNSFIKDNATGVQAEMAFWKSLTS